MSAPPTKSSAGKASPLKELPVGDIIKMMNQTRKNSSTGSVTLVDDLSLQNVSDGVSVTYAMEDVKIENRGKSEIIERTFWARCKGRIGKFAPTVTGRYKRVASESAPQAYPEDCELLDLEEGSEEVELNELIPLNREDRWEYDCLAETSTRSRVGVFNTLNRAIDHSFGTAVCFLGGGKISCSGSYCRMLWEVGDVFPNYAIIQDGALRTFNVRKWAILDAKKTSYIITKYGQPYPGDGWVSFKLSVNRRLLLKSEDVAKENLTFVKLRNASEFDNHAIYAIRDWIDPFDPEYSEKVKESPPLPEVKIVEITLKMCQKANRVPDINFYDLPVEWLHDVTVSPIVKEYVQSLLPKRETKLTIAVKNEEEMQAYFYSAACRIRLQLREEGDVAGLAVANKIVEAYEHGSVEEKRQITTWFDLFTSSEDFKKHESRLGKDIPVHPKEGDETRSIKLELSFEGDEYLIEATDHGNFPLRQAHRLKIGGQSAHSTVLIDALQTCALEKEVRLHRVEFGYFVDSTLKSVTTNSRNPQHGRFTFGEFWHEKCAYSGTYFGVWFQTDEDDPYVKGLVALVNNQIFAEFIHGCLSPDTTYWSESVFQNVTLELISKSKYFDSFEISSSGQMIPPVAFDVSTEWPYSGEARNYPWNLIEVLRKFPVRFEEGNPLISVRGTDGEKVFPYEGNWDVSLYNPEESTDRNYELMFKVERLDSGLQVLLNPATPPKMATPSTVVVNSPVRAEKKTTVDTKKKKGAQLSTQPTTDLVEKKSSPEQVQDSTTSLRESQTKNSKGKASTIRKSMISDKESTECANKTLPAHLRTILGHHKDWLEYVQSNVDKSKTWDNLCEKAQIHGKAKDDLQSDLLDFVVGKPTKRQVGSISKAAFELFVNLDPSKITLTPFTQRKAGKLPTQFTVEF